MTHCIVLRHDDGPVRWSEHVLAGSHRLPRIHSDDFGG